MQETPPAIVMPLPDVSGFSIEGIEIDRPLIIVPRRSACRSSSSDEIVVCARRNDGRYRLRPLPQDPTMMDQINSSLSTQLGPVEIGSLKQADGSRRVGFRIRF